MLSLLLLKEVCMPFSMLRALSILSFTSLLSTSVLFAQEPSNTQQLQPHAANSLVLDLARLGDTFVAVGERGHSFVFDKDWQQVPTPTQATLTKVVFVSEDKGWAVGHDATIMHSQDGGHTWQLQMQSVAIDKPFLDVHFFNEQHGIAVGAYGLFYRTVDGGKKWESEYHQTLLFEEDIAYLAALKADDPALYLSERNTLLPHFNRVIPIGGQQLLMVGELGLVALSSDEGRSWIKQDFPYEGSLFNAHQVGDSIYVMGLRGHLFRAEAALEQWQEVQLPIRATINAAITLNQSVLRVVGNGGAIVDITAQGEVKLIEQRQGENLVAIATDPQDQLWIAGSKGLTQLEQK